MEGKVYCKAVFVMAMNEYTNQWEPMCYFPELTWGNGGSPKTCYTHEEGHNPCCEAFVLLDCKAPSCVNERAAVERLRKEVKGIGYEVDEIPAARFYEDKKGRTAQMKDIVEEMHTVTDSEAQMAMYKVG